jgi:glycosyltransferase involved in cell wall biosynthesis
MTENSPVLAVLVLAPKFPPAYLGGGPIRTLEALVRDAPACYAVSVITSDRDLGETQRLAIPSNRWTVRDGVPVLYVSTDKVVGLWGAFRSVAKQKPDLLYINGFFEPVFSILPQVLWWSLWHRKGTRLLAPRGEFSEGALALKARKKRFYIDAYRLAGLHKGIYWHASSAHEAQDIRRVWGDDCKVIVRENETSLPMRALVPTLSPDPGLRAVFLGRIVPKKGLSVVLAALDRVTTLVYLDIFGSEEDKKYSKECRSLAAQLPPNVIVRFLGVVRPDAVRDTVSPYDVFLMPTAGENFGHVIAESLSVACPVMGTAYTPWVQVLATGGGTVVGSSEPDDWRAAIQDYSALTAEQKLDRRIRAGEAFDRWRSEAKGPHVFDALNAAITPAPSIVRSC